MKPILLVVGSNPSVLDPKGVLTQKSISGRRLKEWLKILNPNNSFEVVLTNVSDQVGKGFYISKKHMEIDRLMELHKTARATLAFGYVASRALSSFTADYFTMYHPSGRNRKLNDKQAVHNKLVALYLLLEEKLREKN